MLFLIRYDFCNKVKVCRSGCDKKKRRWWLKNVNVGLKFLLEEESKTFIVESRNSNMFNIWDFFLEWKGIK